MIAVAPTSSVASTHDESLRETIVLATDASPNAVVATKAAAVIANRLGLPLRVVTVSDPRFAVPALASLPDSYPDMQLLLDQRATFVEDQVQASLLADGVDVEVSGFDAEVGMPSRSISFDAGKHHASLVVLGIGSARDHHILGPKTARKVAMHGSFATLAVNSRWKGLPLSAVAGIDFSAAALAAARMIARIMAPGGVLHLVHVSPPMEAEGSGAIRRRIYDRGAAALLSEMSTEIRELRPQIDVRCEMVNGDTAEQLLKFAAAAHADVVAIGRSNRGVIGHLLGSVAAPLMRHSEGSVLVAPPPSDNT